MFLGKTKNGKYFVIRDEAAVNKTIEDQKSLVAEIDNQISEAIDDPQKAQLEKRKRMAEKQQVAFYKIGAGEPPKLTKVK